MEKQCVSECTGEQCSFNSKHTDSTKMWRCVRVSLKLTATLSGPALKTKQVYQLPVYTGVSLNSLRLEKGDLDKNGMTTWVHHMLAA